MDVRGKVITASLIWTGSNFEEGVQLRIDSTGTIVDIGTNILRTDENLINFEKQALLPGFINAHSHAFHRCMRGKSEIGSTSSDSFWKWRNNMYATVESISPHKLYQYSLATFKEMLSAGITTVGEFHYVHHDENRFALDSVLLDAARDAHIRIVLINTLYCKAGFDNSPLLPAQERFTSTIEEFLENTKKLESIKSSNQTIAVAAHSLRAVSLEDCERLCKWSAHQCKPLHIHVEEQPKEISDCKAANGETPSEILIKRIIIPNPNLNVTAIHCTFTPENVMRSLGTAGAHVCVCPLTEGHLGDGIPNITEENKICLGTDCNNRISMLEEMRMLVYSQHVKFNRRNVCGLAADTLLRIATMNGAASLGLSSVVGSLEKGKQFDFVTFDLTSPRISNSPTGELLDAIVFGAGNEDISVVGVSGIIAHSR